MPSKSTNISTKTGDKGESGLANGERLPKDALVFEVLGTLDELNSWLGYTLSGMSSAKKYQPHRKFLNYVQDTLFYVGAEIAESPKTITLADFLSNIETESESLQSKMEANWVSKFLLPGGTETAARLDLTRTVCRRLERILVTYSRQSEIRPVIPQAINRLSDYLYVLRVWVNLQESYTEEVFES